MLPQQRLIPQPVHLLQQIADLIVGLRVTEDEEREGLDISSHGESAYRM
jgi:Amt family ammonium transporter